jgi:hypothetical protein
VTEYQTQSLPAPERAKRPHDDEEFDPAKRMRLTPRRCGDVRRERSGERRQEREIRGETSGERGHEGDARGRFAACQAVSHGGVGDRSHRATVIMKGQ